MSGHGTRARYQSGCRCLACLEANRLAVKQWRAAHLRQVPSQSAWRPRNGCLGTLCWCERKVVAVLVEHVRAGMTYSCGDDTCIPPAS